MNDFEIRAEANDTAIPQTIGFCILFTAVNFLFSLLISFFFTFIFSLFIYYIIYTSKVKKIRKIHKAIKEAHENIGFNGFTELMALSIDNKKEEIRQILDDGANINSQNDKGYTALMYASNFGRDEIVKFLLERGADRNIITANGNDALHFAKNNKFRGIEKMLSS